MKENSFKNKRIDAPAVTEDDSGSGNDDGLGSRGSAPTPFPTGGDAGSGWGGVAPTGGATPTMSSIGGGGSGGGRGNTVLAAAQTIAAGGSSDGGGATFDRSVSCTGQVEGGGADAILVIESGGEDAFTIKKQAAGETTTITGGSSKGAVDKVFQFNGAGTLSISGFTAESFGSFVRNCGNCKESAERHIIIDGFTTSNGRTLCGINTNSGDTCRVTNTKLASVTNVCMKFTGVSSGSEPKEIGPGADGSSCIYGSDVTGAG
ncbi:hypothetical protein ONS95_005246 [Cadophora gregata]|uniref:uncharacterized protein n=1 Tax=Cadophora gregata TaxID=51156 RepID=UPI0026DB6637|nr:uncharacterized protein ONS95_005246 [Cadophora gregata]KAK0103212.1 hypothetical protein ONS95_005246 [Cadophora gregata]KAK0107399.1 hypothetical protein ONS96_003218 [Cadophora gregata f. sp. sojae]